MTIKKNVLIKELQLKIKNLEAQLERTHNAFYNIISKNQDGILILDNTSKVVYANPAALNLFGKNLGELLGEKIGIFIDTTAKTEITILHRERGPIVIEVNMADITWNNQTAKLASLRDISEHKKTTKILKKLSHYDYLTDLTNRVYFEEALKKSLLRASKAHQKVAVFFLDMDGFKKVNDTYGHQVGDKLLAYVASLLKACLRINDVVSRLGGDEFAIIIEDNVSKKYCEDLARRILEMIQVPIEIDKNIIHVNFSIGIGLFPDNAENFADLVRLADKAMYKAKNSGAGKFHFYGSD